VQEDGRQASGRLASHHAQILTEWLAQTLAGYPEPAGRFLAEEKDRFRNPVGYTLREGLGLLLEQLLGSMEAARLRDALEGIVRVRAVQDFGPRQALGFLPALKDILRRHAGALGLSEQALSALEARIDEALWVAFELYVRCREQIAEVKLGELRRRYFLAERAGWLNP